MQYVEARRLLLGALESEHVESFVQRDELEVIVSLTDSESVHLKLRIALSYGRKRGHTSLTIRPFYWVEGLITHPTDPSSLQHLDGMPPERKQEIVALRNRLNGRVSFAEPPAYGLSVEERIDDWSSEEFLDRLLLAFAASHELAAEPLPAKGPRQFLEWYRALEAQSCSFQFSVSNTWKVVSSAGAQRAA